MNDTPKNHLATKLPDTSEDPSPIESRPFSDRDKSWINKTLREVFSNPPAKKRKSSHEQQRRIRAKQRKKSAPP